MADGQEEIARLFKKRRIIIPILIGLGVVSYLFFENFDKDAFLAINWTWVTSFWIFMGMVMIVVRILAYMYRIWILTDKQLSIKQCFEVIMLWEFASAATPSIVGGTAFALFLLSKEKISTGRSTTIVLFTAFLDELFFILAAPLFFILAGRQFIFPADSAGLPDVSKLVYFFVFGYVALLVYTLAIGYGLFIRPRGLKWLIIKIFSIKFLRKWRYAAVQAGNDIIVASRDLKQKNWKFWAHTFGATVISWSARYFVVNCLILAFAPIDNHFIVYARQVVMWILMLVTPTPGSSGMAEIAFSSFLAEYIPRGLSGSLALLWRLLGYYPFLFLGVIILPKWLRRVYSLKEKPAVADVLDTEERPSL